MDGGCGGRKDGVGGSVGWEEGPDWRRKENDSGDSCVKGEKNIKKHSYIRKEEGEGRRERRHQNP